MCNFNQAWIGTCKKDNVEGADFCAEHEKIKCSVCGEQANHDCEETNQFVCGSPLCGKPECKLQHFYHSHGYGFGTIIHLEEQLQRTPFKIVMAKVDYGTGEIGEWLNKEYKDRIEVLLMVDAEEGKVQFHRANFRYFIKKKSEVHDLFEKTWYKEEVEKKGVYYSEETIKVKETYSLDILDKFDKVIQATPI